MSTETMIVGLASRLMRGSTGAFPKRCCMPTCRAAVTRHDGIFVEQMPRRWAFCSVEHLTGYIRLSQLPEIHADDYIDYADSMGWLR